MNHLQENLDFYIANQRKLVKKYKNKYLIIKDEAIFDAFDSEVEAYFAAKKVFSPGSYSIQFCAPGEEDYSQTFHSRVVLAK